MFAQAAESVVPEQGPCCVWSSCVSTRVGVGALGAVHVCTPTPMGVEGNPDMAKLSY